jgi:hypothetical protein
MHSMETGFKSYLKYLADDVARCEFQDSEQGRGPVHSGAESKFIHSGAESEFRKSLQALWGRVRTVDPQLEAAGEQAAALELTDHPR